MARLLAARLGSTLVALLAITLLVFVVFDRLPEGQRGRRFAAPAHGHEPVLAAYGRSS